MKNGIKVLKALAIEESGTLKRIELVAKVIDGKIYEALIPDEYCMPDNAMTVESRGEIMGWGSRDCDKNYELDEKYIVSEEELKRVGVKDIQTKEQNNE